MAIYLIPLFTFIVAVGSVYAIAAIMSPYRFRLQNRVSDLYGDEEYLDEMPKNGLVDDGAIRWSAFLQRLSPHHAASRVRLERKLNQAGIYYPSALARYHAAKFIASGATATIVYSGCLILGIRYDLSLLVTVLAGSIGLMMPWIWLRGKIRRNHLMLRSAIPDFLDLMIVCLEGGMSLQQTIMRVSDELRIAHPALAQELAYVERDTELGASVDQALKKFADRCGYEGVRTLSTFVRESKRFGTNMTEAMRNHADMLRSQREQAAEENAQKASVKILLPTLLLIFPAIFIVAVAPAIIQIFEAFAAK